MPSIDRENLTTIDYMRAESPLSGHSSEWHFFRSYVGTALWSNPQIDDLVELGVEDFAPETLESMLADCAAFYFTNMGHIHCIDAPLSSEIDGPIGAREAAMAGHDFWLTRCGHGAGFWDGDWPEPAASVLTSACETLGNIDLYVGDDGKIWSA